MTLALPQDVQGEAYDYPDYFLQKRVHRIDRRLATEAMLGDALALLKGKRTPLIICGGGVKYSGANAALQAFAERFDIPFAEPQMASHLVGGQSPWPPALIESLFRYAEVLSDLGHRGDFWQRYREMLRAIHAAREKTI